MRSRHSPVTVQTDSTLGYIHLSGRDLADKLSRVMAQMHAWRVRMFAGPAAPESGGVEHRPQSPVGGRDSHSSPRGPGRRRHGRDRRASCSDSGPLPSSPSARRGLRRNRATAFRGGARHWQLFTDWCRHSRRRVNALSYGDDARFRRPGRETPAAIVLRHCADTGRFWAWRRDLGRLLRLQREQLSWPPNAADWATRRPVPSLAGYLAWRFH